MIKLQWVNLTDKINFVEDFEWEVTPPTPPLELTKNLLKVQWIQISDSSSFIEEIEIPIFEKQPPLKLPNAKLGHQWRAPKDISNYFVDFDIKFFVRIEGEYGFFDEEGEFVALGDGTPTEKEFEEKGMSSYIEDLNENALKLMSESRHVSIINYHECLESKMRIAITPTKSLILANGDLSLKAVDNIDYFKVDKTLVEQAEVKIIVSVDEGKNWNTYDSGVWEEITPTVDQVDLYGIDSSVFDLIPPKKWNDLRKYSDTIRFGYLLKHNGELDFAKVHALNAQFDMTGTWKASIHGKDFEYEYPDNSTIKVKILKDGDYKINY